MANLRTNNLSGEQGQNAYRGSVFFDGQDPKLSIATSTDFALGTDDYTIEAWVRFSKIDTYQSIIDFRAASNGNYPFIVRDTDGDLYYYINGSKLIDNIPARENNTWHHIAVVRSSGTTNFYLNGVSEGNASDSTNYIADNPVLIGAAHGNGNDMFGYISNLRITKEALYTSTFTPPFSELKVLANTVLLCCQDSDDPTQEATGKTITASSNLADADLVKQQPKVIPPYGVDAGNAFGGSIQQSSQGYMYFPTGRTEERGRGFVVFAGGINPSSTSLMEYVHIPSGGNTFRFGDLAAAKKEQMAVASRVKGIWGGGHDGSYTNSMEFVTLATSSNTTDFGDLTVARGHGGAVQNSTRGVFMIGYNPSNQNVMDFVTMATNGDATDFGDAIVAGWPCGGGRSSSTRGVLMGMGDSGNTIQFITIMTTGNSQDFGDLNTSSYGVGAGEISDGLRGVAMGGSGSPADQTNVIDFITIATTGNATDFGDLTQARRGGGAGCTLTRGILGGGRNPSDVNVIDSIIIQTTGNATDFGDLIGVVAFNHPGCSDSHGGLT